MLTFHVGDMLRKARDLRGWNLDELAGRTRLTRNAISEAERQAANTKRETYERLAAALEVKMSDLHAAAETINQALDELRARSPGPPQTVTSKRRLS